MGSSASSGFPDDPPPAMSEEKGQRLKAKVLTVAAMSAAQRRAEENTKTRPSSGEQRVCARAELLALIQRTKEEKEAAWEDIQGEEPDHTRHQRTNKPAQQPDELAFKTDIDNRCGVCDQAILFDHEGCPCRICGRLYHPDCLETSGQYANITELHGFLSRAREEQGWSCYNCEKLWSLLKEEEMSDMLEEFERFDINRDSSISLEEYMSYRQRVHRCNYSTPMPAELEVTETAHFKAMDADQSGTLEWWEFLNHQATQLLRTRPKDDLVASLTGWELTKAKRIFDILDEDGSGTIDSREARKFRLQWHCGVSSHLLRSKMSTDDMAHQVSLLETADQDTDGEISWDEFIKSKALSILCSRPNKHT